MADKPKPFGYFRAEPFGWTDCAPTDEGAIPLYEAPSDSQKLDDFEISHLFQTWWKKSGTSWGDFARMVEAAVRKKAGLP